jgi:NurA-like 5'-3' nuclease
MVGRVSELDADLGELVKKNWSPVVEVSIPDREVLAVDGSRAIRPFASGAILYIARSLAIHRKKRFRELEVDSFLCKAKSSDIQAFVNTRMESLEYKVAIQAIEKSNLSKSVILIDGSLYGRLTHLPRDLPAEGMKDFMLDYFESYFRLLELCRERSILILGVSKDSRSSFFRDFLLKQIFDGAIKEINNLSVLHKRDLYKVFKDVFVTPSTAFNSFNNLLRIYGDKLHGIEQILYEAVAARSDHQIICSYIEKSGHTIPIEHSLSRNNASLLKQMENNPQVYLKRYFKNAFLEAKEKDSFIERGEKVIRNIPKFPSMISFHVLLDPRDTPIRVDTPSWTFNRDNKISDFVGERSVLVVVNDIISLLIKGYGGLKNYNIWLKRVDEEVRLSNNTVDQIYSSALEKTLDFTIIHTRGYRRVKYP